MTAIILAGGEASRMGGRNKALLKIGKETLIKRQLRLIKFFFKRIIIVTNSVPKFKQLQGVRLVTDIKPHLGPLGGIYSGLLASKDKYNFVFACDMPNLNLKLIKYMIKQKKGFDVVVPSFKKGYETLFAIYSKNCIRPIYKTLNSENLRIRNFFKKVRVRKIASDEVKRFVDPEVLFMNINTPLDYKKFCNV